MNKTIIGLLFILAGLCYGSLVFDDIYNLTLGWLVANDWVKPPPPDKNPDSLRNLLGRKPTIVLYSLFLILIGIFILWNRDS